MRLHPRTVNTLLAAVLALAGTSAAGDAPEENQEWHLRFLVMGDQLVDLFDRVRGEGVELLVALELTEDAVGVEHKAHLAADIVPARQFVVSQG